MTRKQYAAVFDANQAAIKALEELEPYRHHNAGVHNSHYRGKQIEFNDALSAAIQAGSFSGTYGGKFIDVYVGDSFHFENVAYSYKDENNKTVSDTFSGSFRVADLDYFRYSGDTSLNDHHIVVVPANALYDAAMNDTDITDGGYVGTKMRTVHLRRAEAIIKACFGASHVITHRDCLINAVSNGVPVGATWTDSVVELMDERMVYGSLINEPSVSSNGTIADHNAVTCKQFNMFRHYPAWISNRISYWLRNVVSGTHFSFVHGYGHSRHQVASSVLGVRPYALIY